MIVCRGVILVSPVEVLGAGGTAERALSSLQDAETSVTCYVKYNQQVHVSGSGVRRRNRARGMQRPQTLLRNNFFLRRRTDGEVDDRFMGEQADKMDQPQRLLVFIFGADKQC